MRYSRLLSAITIVSLLAVFALPARGLAADEVTDRWGIYGGLGYGAGFFESPDDEEDAWRLMAWFRMHKYVSAEVGYIDAGEPKGMGGFDGLHLALVPTIPLTDKLEIFGKAGGFFLEGDDNVAAGAGVAYYVWKGFGVRLDWDRLNADDDDAVNVLTLAAFYHLSR